MSMAWRRFAPSCPMRASHTTSKAGQFGFVLAPGSGAGPWKRLNDLLRYARPLPLGPYLISRRHAVPEKRAGQKVFSGPLAGEKYDTCRSDGKGGRVGNPFHLLFACRRNRVRRSSRSCCSTSSDGGGAAASAAIAAMLDGPVSFGMNGLYAGPTRKDF
jgi:hypothetical protein